MQLSMHLSHTPTLGVSPTDQRPGNDSEAWVPDSEERLILREEFTSRMHQRFLDGKDGHLKSLLSEPSSPGLRAALRELLTNAPGPGDTVHLDSPPTCRVRSLGVFHHR